MAFFVAFAVLVAVVPSYAETAANQPVVIVAWNVESGGADPAIIGQRLADFQDVDLWGFSEVNDAQDGERYEAAAEVGEGTNFASVLSTSGGGDRLLAIYDTARFALLSSEELNDINIGGNVRAPLVLHVK